ncbi:unnamed protein product [Closterium sp. Naga37s-1]|nr:unnamed protein product [Closterium sp. Naga37s-1]
MSPSLTNVQSVAQPCLQSFQQRLHPCRGLATRTSTDSSLLQTDSFSIVESTGFGCSSPAESAAVQSALADVSAGLLAGQVPEITPDGSGGTYMLRDVTGESRIAVFKPMDEEPLAWNCPRGMPPSLTGEGLKRGTRVGEGAFREVAAYLLDHPLREGDAEGFAGVPRTALVTCDIKFFASSLGSPVSILGGLSSAEFGSRKIGSLQHFVPAISNCEDMGPARFAASEVHKIATLDMRLANTDRNGANILVKSDGSDLKLIPIDHGYCLPETLEDCTFEWLYWPQAKQPLCEDVREYIAKLDAEADLALLQAGGWAVNGACARVFRAATLLLKRGSAANRTIFDIGSLMVRDDPDVPSALEVMLARAEEKALSGAAGGDAINWSAAVQRTLADVSAGLLAGQAPEITPDGSGGTYMLRDATGESRIAVFKPMDEEPLAWNCPRGMPPSLTGEGLKRGTRVGEGAFREVAAYLLDHPLREGDAEGFAGVPRTSLVTCDVKYFASSLGSPVSILGGLSSAEPGIRKIGSLQQFVPAMSNCEDMGPARFAASEVHKIAVLDMRLANADRNGANILVKRDGTDLKLIPIDHGYCLPETLEDCTFEWLYWPQAKQPLSEEVREYIARLDAEADLSLLHANGWAVKDACARVFRAATLLLKKGSAANITVFEIGSLMVRDDPEVPSALEDMLARAEEKALSGGAGGDIMKCLGEIIDLYLGV